MRFTHGRFVTKGKRKSNYCVAGVIYDDVSSLVAEAVRPHNKEARGKASREKDNDDWAGVPFGTAIKMAEEGWPEGAEASRGLAEVMEGQIGMALLPTFVRHMDVSGVEPDVPAYLSGEPECMVDYRLVERERAGRVVKVFVDVAASSGFSKSVLQARAAAVMAFCMACHEQGDTVEVWIGQTVTPGPFTGDGTLLKMHGVACCVQKAGEIFDEDRLAFMVGHPSVLRRLMFAVEEHAPDWVQDGIGVGSGYGVPTRSLDQTKEFLRAHVEDVTGEFDVIVPSLNTGAKLGNGDDVDWDSVRDRTDWIREQLQGCGFEMEDQPKGAE